jgi:hypothetical protein
VARHPAVDDQWCGRLVCQRITPSAVTAATAEYFDNQDLFGQWLQESCDVDLDNHHLMETINSLSRVMGGLHQDARRKFRSAAGVQ